MSSQDAKDGQLAQNSSLPKNEALVPFAEAEEDDDEGVLEDISSEEENAGPAEPENDQLGQTPIDDVAAGISEEDVDWSKDSIVCYAYEGEEDEGSVSDEVVDLIKELESFSLWGIKKRKPVIPQPDRNINVSKLLGKKKPVAVVDAEEEGMGPSIKKCRRTIA